MWWLVWSCVVCSVGFCLVVWFGFWFGGGFVVGCGGDVGFGCGCDFWCVGWCWVVFFVLLYDFVGVIW